MSWEWLNTAFAGGTFVVITATAITATIQLRHLRSSNQLLALTTVMGDWQREQLQERLRFVRWELAEKIKDPVFRRSLESPDRTKHPELQLSDYFEFIGACMKYGLLQKESFIDAVCGPIVSAYASMRPVLDILRIQDPRAYENFEYLATECKLWMKRHSDGSYPKGFPRFTDL
ncbi:MAG TPA: hypothetical protein VEW74_02415 [Candidatus Nitrosotalea sp.]|nr:hypothetical protein [Candidatus Nitrosotalea sp.]